MRKLAWLLIIALIVALGIAVGCLLSPEFSSTLYDVGVNVIGASVVTWFTGLSTGMMLWGSGSLAQAWAVILGVGITMTVLWMVLLRKYIWNPIKGAVKPSASAATITLRGGPEPELPQTVEQSTEVKKEA